MVWPSADPSTRRRSITNYDAYLEALKARRDEAKVRLALLRDSAGDAWQELRKGSDEAWESIRHAVAEARKKFGG